MKRQPRVAIIGASGQIGRALHKTAVVEYDTIGTSTRGGLGLLPLKLEKPHAFARDHLAEGDMVILTAAISAPDVCSKQPDLARSVNVEGASCLIETALAQRARVVFLSSDTVYGERAKPFDESCPVDPAGDYAQMKHAVEQQFLGDPLFKTVRLSYVFFRDDKLTDYLRKCSETGERAELFDPFQRSVVYLHDVVKGLISLVDQWDRIPLGIINMGGPNLVSRVDFAACLRKYAFPSLTFTISEPPPSFFVNRPKSIYMLSPLFESLLGRKPMTLDKAAATEFSPVSQRHNSSQNAHV